MQSFAKPNELPEEMRGKKRSRVLLAAMLHMGEQTLKANLLNMSATGAQLDATTPPAMHTKLTLWRGNLEARARVVWVSDHRFGILFDEPLDEAVLAEHTASRALRKKIVSLR